MTTKTEKNQKVRIHVSGMTCTTCVARVEEALKRVPGVVSVNANLASERATVEYIRGTFADFCPPQFHCRADYSLSLRFGTGDADSYHGGNGKRGGTWLTHKERRGTGKIL